jgi:hypothetical protein
MCLIRVVVWLTIVWIIPAFLWVPAAPAASVGDKYDAFAQCLTKKQAAMYGAYWCPHCNDQKKDFGASFQYVHYVECAVQGQPPNVQTPACKATQIKKYPTWVFVDGERIEATQTLEQLSQKTGCKLP